MDSGTWNFGGGAGVVVGAGGGGLDGAGGRRSCTEHIQATAAAVPPPTAAPAAGRSLGDAMGCCRGGWPICAGCLGTVVDSTSHWRADVWHQARFGNADDVWMVLVVVVDDEEEAVVLVVGRGHSSLCPMAFRANNADKARSFGLSFFLTSSHCFSLLLYFKKMLYAP